MKYNPNIHHRKSIRLKGYNYSQDGIYFITVCAYNRDCLFGKIVNDRNGEKFCELNEFGKIAKNEWLKTSEIRKNIKLDAFVIMPNHIHGIMIINNMIPVPECYGMNTERYGRGTMHRAPTQYDISINNHIPATEQFGKPTSNSIPTIIRGFKSAVTKQINILRNIPSAPVWQKNYYEHIIRDEKSYNKICEYINNNPFNWESDSLNKE